MSKITICEGNIILTSKKDTIIHAFNGNITSNAQQKNIWKGEKGTVIGDYEVMELPTVTAEVIEVGFAKQEVKDSTTDNTKKVMSLPIKGSFAMGEKVFLKVKTLGLIGKKIKIEVRQAVEKQLTEKDQKIEALSVAEMTVGKITQSEDAKNKYEATNLKALQNIAMKEMMLEPKTEEDKKKWKDILAKSKEKKIKLYFHVEVLDAEAEVIYKGDDNNDKHNFSTKTPFELTEGGKCFCNRDFTVDEMIGIIYNLRDKQKMISKRDVFFNMGGEYISSLRVSTGKLTDDVNKAKIKLFTDELNSMFKKFSINTCKRKIHFIGQMYLETIYFRYTYESRSSVPSNYGGGVPFQGRGMKQITHDYNYLSYYDYVNNTKMYDKYDKFRNHPKNKIESVGDCIQRSSEARKDGLDGAFYEKLKTFAKNLSQNLFHSFNSAGWYSTVRQRKTIDAMDEGFSDEIIKKVTKAINGGDNGLAERINFTNWTKEHLKYDSKCINK
mgnify:CR=1 FL=1|jgi:predicted chitinase